ncbi:hypothetical protein H696_00871 [Fonticula alba]|uniref:Uncharacterized protein n=1 Tax=Fonticula alba TaxID=691883 RepID=A0A058ZG09_FONAL|nr:hypothetical protein H696_00871 [Fonticula alba]KCV73330.1 hypothetical protein H696_00871 [Fonticula alba]|eukprot:XP_009493031.1 hypothetical protein H696_00871 [Fonticula alba]
MSSDSSASAGTPVPPMMTSQMNSESAILTIRVIRSITFRNSRNLILRNINLKTTTGRDLLEMSLAAIATESAFRPFRTITFDTLKIYHTAHMSKKGDLIINTGSEHLVLDPHMSLWDSGVRNESEISLYNKAMYLEYLADPRQLWE